jgi:hypothetical protein
MKGDGGRDFAGAEEVELDQVCLAFEGLPLLAQIELAALGAWNLVGSTEVLDRRPRQSPRTLTDRCLGRQNAAY